MLLSLFLPLIAGGITRLALRPRGQGQNNITINLPLWTLAVMWPLVVLLTLGFLAGPTGQRADVAVAMIAMASAAGILIPEVFRGAGQATTAGLSRPRNWLWLGVGGTILYGLFVDSSILEGLFLLGVLWIAYRVILGMVKPPKKGGG